MDGAGIALDGEGGGIGLGAMRVAAARPRAAEMPKRILRICMGVLLGLDSTPPWAVELNGLANPRVP